MQAPVLQSDTAGGLSGVTPQRSTDEFSEGLGSDAGGGAEEPYSHRCPGQMVTERADDGILDELDVARDVGEGIAEEIGVYIPAARPTEGRTSHETASLDGRAAPLSPQSPPRCADPLGLAAASPTVPATATTCRPRSRTPLPRFRGATTISTGTSSRAGAAEATHTTTSSCLSCHWVWWRD